MTIWNKTGRALAALQLDLPFQPSVITELVPVQEQSAVEALAQLLLAAANVGEEDRTDED